VNGWSGEATDNPPRADPPPYKVEKWTKDNTKIDRMLYAGNNLDKAREMFAARSSGSRAKLSAKLGHRRVAAADVRLLGCAARVAPNALYFTEG
jgi:hypothetical protein